MNRIDIRQRKIGLVYSAAGSSIRVWAPGAKELYLVTPNEKLPLTQHEKRYWQGLWKGRPGDRYRFLLDGQLLPDPASLLQPEGVHSWSALTDTAYAWTDTDWKNPPLQDYIFYELHTGTFSEEGTFAGIGKKLDYLKNLGITAIELMPVAQFPGTRNWGYDGVFPFAVQHSYGGAKGLQHLVDKCHEKGLAVVLDVVYNHLGPEGNYFKTFGPYFTDKYKTPWGEAINFDDAGSDQVRDFYMENALMWFRDFHVDALRLDAVHAIKDFGAQHILRELRHYTDELSAWTGRTYHLIIECDLNDRRFLDPQERNGYAMDAQWSDEFHHALRVSAGAERKGYYADFEGPAHLAKAYRDAYVYDGRYSAERQRTFGSKTDGLDGSRFIVFSQNHDQVGNRMQGERTAALHSFEMLKLLAAAVLTSPYLPLIFMGEEWGSRSPFQYFISHSDKELVEAVRQGRKAEFSGFFDSDECPDPQAETTFTNSRLDWENQTAYPHNLLLLYYSFLIALRKKYPALHTSDRTALSAEADANGVLILRRGDPGQQVLCLMNFSAQQQRVPMSIVPSGAHLLLDSAAAAWGGPGRAVPESLNTIILQPESVILYGNEPL